MRVRKAVIPTRGGVVAAAHCRAAEVGAAVLEDGGDAVDAAVAVSFAIGVVEPWMSGPATPLCSTSRRFSLMNSCCAAGIKSYTGWPMSFARPSGPSSPTSLRPAGFT